MKERKRQSINKYLVFLLSRRDYPESGLLTKLVGKGYSLEESKTAILWAKENQLFNEQSFIVARVRGLLSKGYAPKIIKLKMQANHITITISKIQEIMETYNISITDIINKNLSKCKRKSNSQTINYLLRRGILASDLEHHTGHNIVTNHGSADI